MTALPPKILPLSRPNTGDPSARAKTLLSHLAHHLPDIRSHAAALDETARFPIEDIQLLQFIGGLTAPLPTHSGGLGIGTDPAAAETTSYLLQMLGSGHVAVARLYEAHVNAIRLIARYGTQAQLRRVAADCEAGHLISLWVTDAPDNPLRATANGTLVGTKAICSGAGHITRSLVTAQLPGGATRLAYLNTGVATATPLPARMQGVRAATTGRVSFDGLPITHADWIGQPGDYLREPDFSAGAWRTSAVTAGCLARLVECAIAHLDGQNRAANPHQQTRIGRAWIARETARLWVHRAALIAEGAEPTDPETIVATVNFARIAVEAASVETLNLIERSIGLQAFLAGTEIERLRRDLGTYLRQPAPDEVLTEAAAHIVRTHRSH